MTSDMSRRRFERAPLRLPGRYLAPDNCEYSCETIDVSPGGVRLRAPRIPTPGWRIIVYLDQLGRIEGAVVRTMRDGFAVAIRCTPRKTERLERKIDWLLRRDEVAADRRARPRFEQEGAYLVMLTDSGGEHLVELLDVSEFGVAFRTDLALKIGDRVELGLQKAAVSRLFEGGAAANFV